MHLTPAIIETAYEYLRSTPPFKGWRLPHADDVEFHIYDSPRHLGHATAFTDGSFRIKVSRRLVKGTHSLMETLAHEMVHVRQVLLAPGGDGMGHAEDFKKLAAQVCRYHGFKPEGF